MTLVARLVDMETAAAYLREGLARADVQDAIAVAVGRTYSTTAIEEALRVGVAVLDAAKAAAQASEAAGARP